jgi:hypothetical protein
MMKGNEEGKKKCWCGGPYWKRGNARLKALSTKEWGSGVRQHVLAFQRARYSIPSFMTIVKSSYAELFFAIPIPIWRLIRSSPH